MTSRTKLEKFGGVALAAACVFLAFKLISEIDGSPVEAARGQDAAARSASHSPGSPKRLGKEINQLASADPSLEIHALKEYVTRPLPDNLRDPFDFAAPPPPKNGPAGSGGGVGGAAGGIGGNAAPPPPQISLHALGYSLREGVGGEAYLADADQVYIVHQGDMVMKQYKILRITPSIVEVRNGASGETVQLPIPEAQ
ncbi:MAG TPA: hypothetical protein VMV34_03560 [Terriglobia bacterium]|nr:hypothetical protein [Terriglobia bacterium]